MKKIFSVFLSLVLMASMLCSLNLSAYADTYDAGTLTIGSTNIVIEKGGDVARCAFTPEQSGCYAFFTDCDLDTMAYAYNSDMNRIAENDDYGRDLNFYLCFNANAGEKYYLEFRCFNNYDIGSFEVKSFYLGAMDNVSFEFSENAEVVVGYASNDVLRTEGNRIIVNYEDSTQEIFTYTADAYGYCTTDGKYISSDNLSLGNCDDLEVGVNDVTVSIFDVNVTAQLRAVENPVQSIDFTTGGYLVENEDCIYDDYYDYNGQKHFRKYYSVYNVVYNSASVLTVHRKDGSVINYHYDSEYAKFIDDNGNGLDRYIDYYDNQTEKEFTVAQIMK